MKKLIAAMLFLLATQTSQAATEMQVLGTLVRGTLLDHVSYTGQLRDGESRGAFVDSIVKIGSYNGRSIFDIQAGFAGEAKPETATETGVKWICGGLFKVSSLIRDTVKFADHWEFLNALEYGVKYDYDFTDKRDYVSIQVGLAFSLEPKK